MKKIKIFKLKEEDILVFNTEDIFSKEQSDKAKTLLKEEMGIKNKMIFLGPNIDLNILRK